MKRRSFYWSRSEPDLWNLLHLKLDLLVIIYPDISRRILSATRSVYKTKIDKGELGMPPRNPEWDGNPEAERDRASERRKRISKSAAEKLVGMVVMRVPEEHEYYHRTLQQHLDEHGRADKARFSDYQMGMKNADGEFESHDLRAARFEVKFDVEPQWPPVTRIESVTLPRKESKKAPEDSKSAIILPDLQIPFQDKEAVSVALQIVRDVKPDKIIILGDMLDLSAWGKYEQRPEFAQATQGAIIEAHTLLATLRKLSPTAEIVVIGGNHEARMEKSLLANAQAAYGLRRADEPEGWPVMSVPYLCAFDQLDVDYLDGYPASRYWINERLQVRHGNRVRSSGSTAKLVSDDERVSTIFGHIHRIETHYKTTTVYDGGRINAAHAIGCLCRIDGAVPSVHNGYKLDGGHVTNFENWQQGLSVVGYQEGDSPFSIQQVFINTVNGYETHFNGNVYRPNEKL